MIQNLIVCLQMSSSAEFQFYLSLRGRRRCHPEVHCCPSPPLHRPHHRFHLDTSPPLHTAPAASPQCPPPPRSRAVSAPPARASARVSVGETRDFSHVVCYEHLQKVGLFKKTQQMYWQFFPRGSYVRAFSRSPEVWFVRPSERSRRPRRSCSLFPPKSSRSLPELLRCSARYHTPDSHTNG